LLPPVLLSFLALRALELAQLAPLRPVQSTLLLQLFQPVRTLLGALYRLVLNVGSHGFLLLPCPFGATQFAQLAPLGLIEPALLLQALDPFLCVLLLRLRSGDCASLDCGRLLGLPALLDAHLTTLGPVDCRCPWRGALEGRGLTLRDRHARSLAWRSGHPRRWRVAHGRHLAHRGRLTHNGRLAHRRRRGPRHRRATSRTALTIRLR
jgi:hypothetical protein